jgi:Flp pilus assembly protein TadD
VVCSLGDVLIETGKTTDAIPALERASAHKPSLGCARYELGRAWFRQGQYEKAEGHLEAATALNPAYAPAYVLLGQCYAKLGKSEKAQAAFQKSRALDQEHLERIQQKVIPGEQSTEQLNPQ